MTAQLTEAAANYCRVDDALDATFLDCADAAEAYLVSAGVGDSENASPVWKMAFFALTLHYYDSRHDVSASAALPASLRLLINQLKREADVEAALGGMA